MKRILVTGGAGFIGSHLCERLLARGDEVLCVDNFFTSRRQNIRHLFGNLMFEFMRHDITWPLYVEVDQIYNLACPASPVHYQFDPVQTTKTNVHGAINMLGLAKRLKIRILQSSTSEIYGSPIEHPQKETYWGNVNPIGPRACYDEGKRCAETLFFDYHRQHTLEIRVVRIFNTFGPRMHPNDGRVVSNFVIQALKNDPITIYGQGNQTRSFCYVDDLVSGMVAMMDQDEIMGPVNPLALEEYQSLQERHTFLQGQLDDIRGTRRELSKVIASIDEEIVTVFASAFADVAVNFQHLFETLFPGGQGSLALTTPEDLLLAEEILKRR